VARGGSQEGEAMEFRDRRAATRQRPAAGEPVAQVQSRARPAGSGWPAGLAQRVLVDGMQAGQRAMEQRRSIQRMFGPSVLAPLRAPVQAKPIPALNTGARTGGSNRIWVGGEEADAQTFWTAPLGSKGSRAALIQAAATQAAALGSEIDGIVNDQWNMKPDELGNKANKYFDPLMVRLAGDYGGNEMALDFHFGSSFSGYVIRVHDPHAGIDNQTMSATPDELDETSEYGNVHEVQDHPAGTILNTDGADAVTKLAGEGARWQCVGSNVGVMRDDTRIYTNENSAGTVSSSVRYVGFPVLWKSWAAAFGKQYGIADATVAEKLGGANLRITTSDGVKDSPVGVASSATMRHGVDVCVDSAKPAGQGDLNHLSVQFLRFTKPKGRVFNLQSSLQDQVAAMALLVNAIPGVTYKGVGACTGMNTFEFLCAVTGPAAPVLAGYTVTDVGVPIQYPRYRENVLAGNITNNYDPPAQSGEEAYLALMSSTYEHHVGVLRAYISDNIDINIDGVEDLDAVIRSKLLAWDEDIDSDLPDSSDYTGGDKDEDIRRELDAVRVKPKSTDESDLSGDEEPAQDEPKSKGGKSGKKVKGGKVKGKGGKSG
jgi:hypothetical protein